VTKAVIWHILHRRLW